MNQMMIDIETLGTQPGSIITQIGACVFDEKEIIDSMSMRISVADSLKLGLVINPDTFNWWLRQDKNLFLQQLNGICLIKDSLRILFERYNALSCHAVWAYGNMDTPMIEHCFIKFGWKAPWGYRDVMDMRTLAKLNLIKESDWVNPETPHDALSDAVAQTKTLINFFKKD